MSILKIVNFLCILKYSERVLKLKYKKTPIRSSLDNIITSTFDNRPIHSNINHTIVKRIIQNVQFAMLNDYKTQRQCIMRVYRVFIR